MLGMAAGNAHCSHATPAHTAAGHWAGPACGEMKGGKVKAEFMQLDSAFRCVLRHEFKMRMSIKNDNQWHLQVDHPIKMN